MTPPRPVVRSRMPVGASFMLAAMVLVLLVSAGPAYAATHISGTTYTSNTTWTLANSPYVLDGDVTVASGATLTLEPGVVVKFNGTFRQLSVTGILSAVGTAGSHIVFTSYKDDTAGGDTNGDGSATQGAPGEWYAINVNSGNGSSQLKFADIRYGGLGSQKWNYGALSVTGSGTSVLVEDSTFTNNQASGIHVGTQDTAGVTVRRTTLSNNGDGISANGGWMKVEDNSSVKNNSEDGLWWNLSSTFAGTQSHVLDSEVRANSRDGVRLQVETGLDVGKWPRGTRSNIYENASKQLYTLNTKRTADWKGNYWGEGVYHAWNSAACLGSGQNSRGKLAYRSSQGNPPAGPLDADLYTVGFPQTICGYDRVAVGAIEFQPFAFRGAAGMAIGQSLGPAGGRGELAEDQTESMDDPLNSFTGSSFSSVTDLKLPGIGVTFAFTRAYNGIDAAGGALGPGWTHSYNASLTIKTGGDVTVRAGSGQQLEFVKNPDGSFTAAAGRTRNAELDPGRLRADHVRPAPLPLRHGRQVHLAEGPKRPGPHLHLRRQRPSLDDHRRRRPSSHAHL